MSEALSVQNSPRHRIAHRLKMRPEAFDIVMASIMPTGASDAERLALLVIADEYRLNPVTKEIHAFKGKGGGIVPIVGIDGWIRIVNEHPQFDGVDFEYVTHLDETTGAEVLDGVATVMYRKDRTRPTRCTEWMDECRRNTDPWKQSPRRMLRHKSYIQCARLTFGFSGIYDPDEGERIVDAVVVEDRPKPQVKPLRGVAALAEKIREPEPEEQGEPEEPQEDEQTGEWLDARGEDPAGRDALLAAYKAGMRAKGNKAAQCPFHVMEQPFLQEAWSRGFTGEPFDIADALSRQSAVSG